MKRRKGRTAYTKGVVRIPRHKTTQGYIVVSAPHHPKVVDRHSKRVFEHIIIMENVLKRYLLPNENVHHKNGIRDDNRPENLELWIKSQPAGQRVSDIVAWAIEILNIYSPEALVEAAESRILRPVQD